MDTAAFRYPKFSAAPFEQMRKDQRRILIEPCRVSFDGREIFATTRNISMGGVCVDIVGGEFPEQNAPVTIHLRTLPPILARTLWSHHSIFGLKFEIHGESDPELRAMVESIFED